MTAATGGNVSAPVPADDPRMIAWKKYQATDDYANARRNHIEGALWAAFIAGFEAGRQYNKQQTAAAARYRAERDDEDDRARHHEDAEPGRGEQ